MERTRSDISKERQLVRCVWFPGLGKLSALRFPVGCELSRELSCVSCGNPRRPKLFQPVELVQGAFLTGAQERRKQVQLVQEHPPLKAIEIQSAAHNIILVPLDVTQITFVEQRALEQKYRL